MKISRNDPCFCGSGVKYKKCHYLIDAGYVKVRNKFVKGAYIDGKVFNLGRSIGGKK